MDKKPLIVVSLCAVVLLVLGSLSNVVGYQTVQTSQQNIIKERINQRELLFQTICDMVNDKEIQRIILKSQMSRGIFPTAELPLVTKQQIRQMYFLGLILSKVISKSRIQSMIGEYQFDNQDIQNEINAVIEKDATLNNEIIQLQNSECDCENKTVIQSNHPILCFLLSPFAYLAMSLFFVYLVLVIIFGLYPGSFFLTFMGIFYDNIMFIGRNLNCYWYPT